MRNFFRSVKKIKSKKSPLRLRKSGIELLGGNFELFVILFVILPEFRKFQIFRFKADEGYWTVRDRHGEKNLHLDPEYPKQVGEGVGEGPDPGHHHRRREEGIHS